MGLSSSQARLLTLTSRQHSIEGEAHRLQANKLRLSNDSDTAYMKYLNALDDTFLKTRQVKNDTGAASWIDASINNLMRYQTSDETTGKVFYVQDIGTGKLYIPTEIGRSFDSASNYRDFVTGCDSSITYEEVIENIEIEKKYQETISRGYDKVLGATDADCQNVLNDYYRAKTLQENLYNKAYAVKRTLPSKNTAGNYYAGEKSQIGMDYLNAIAELRATSEYDSNYTAAEKKIIAASVALVRCMDVVNPESVVTDNSDQGFASNTMTVTYALDKIESSKNDNIYTSSSNKYGFTETFLSMLNGGTVTWCGQQRTNIDFKYIGDPDPIVIDVKLPLNIYDISIEVDNVSTTINNILSTYGAGAATMGQALTNIFNRVTQSKPLKTFLNSHAISEEDITHYLEYKEAAARYASYTPIYVWKASDEVKAAYYEEIYNAITAAGGWIEADEARAKNGTWVSNMVKNAQVIITDWDESKEILTNTTTALVTNLKEVTDQNYIEKVSQEYEDTLNTINAKDARFDKRLAQLESERSAIMTEVDGLKSVMKNNIEKTFKVFG